jgi:hypothetical protein
VAMAASRIAVPEVDLARIRRYCEGRVPAHVRDQVRLEVDVRGTAVTIVECRAPWKPEFGPVWTRLPVARLRFVAASGVWTLNWRDRNEAWHRYTRIEPSKHLDALLADTAPDPTAIFWG